MLRFSDPAAIGRHRAFLNMAPTDRFVFTANIGFYMPEVFPNLCQVLPRGPVSPDDIQIDPFLKDIERLYHDYDQLGDDLPFAGAPFVFVPWMEAIMGCPIHAAENSMWAEPAVEDWDTWHWQRPVLDENPWVQKLLELMAAMVDHSAGRYMVSHTLMRGVADLLSAMRGAARYAMDFYDYPETVHRAAELIADVWVDVAKAQLDLVQPSDNGYVAGASWRAWAPDKIAWLQEDAMALLSPRLFREFILPQDRRILSQFPYTGFHLHASALWAIDDLTQVSELDILELNYESARIDEQGTFDAWKKTQEHKPLAIWKEFDGDPFWDWLDRVERELSAEGLLLMITVANLQEGIAVKERITGQRG